jgi:hypothetical protein
MVTMNDALIELVDSNQVEPQEAYLKATDKVGIIHMLKQRGKDVSFADVDDAKAAGAASGPETTGSSKPAARTSANR